MTDYTPVSTGLDRLGTIEAYATPDQLKEARAYAAALQFGHGQQPVKHWTQGLSNMVASLMGGYQAGQTNRAENSRIQRESAAGVPDIGTPGAPPPVAKHADAGDAGATPTAYAPGSSLDDVYTNAVAKIESGGNPRNVTGSNRGLMQFGPEEERKYGITNWQDPDQQTAALAKERADHHARLVKALGRAPTPSELYLTHQQGPAGGPALLAGDPNEPAWKAIRPYYKSDRMAQLAISGNIPSDSPLKQVPVDRISKGTFAALWDAKYNRFAGRAGGGQPPVAPDGPSAGSALAFAGVPANPGGGPDDATSGWLKSLDAGVAPGATAAPGDPESMASALTPVGQRAPAAPPSGQLQPPGAGAPPPGVFPQRAIMSREKLQTILSSPDSRVSQGQKDLAMKMYIEQFQPQQFKGTFGTWTMGTDGKPYFQSDLLKSKEESGGHSQERLETIEMDPSGRPVRRRVGTGAPEVPAATAPAAVPSAAPTTVPSLKPGSLKYDDNPNPPPKPQSLNEAPGEAGPVLSDAAPIGGPGDQLALNGPPPVEGEEPKARAFTPEDTGMLATKPPAPVNQKVAQAAIDPEFKKFIDEGNAIDREQKNKLEYDKGENESYKKDFTDTMGLGERAEQSIPQLSMMRKIIEDPKFQQGYFANPQVAVQKLKAAFGIDPSAARANETFEKLASGQILGDLKVQTQGLGQIRVAEIQLAEKAFANRHNTLEANRAVLNIAIRAHQQMAGMAEMVGQYARGVRWDAQGNPKVDRNGNAILDPNPPTNEGLKNLKKMYLKNNPLYKPEEIEHINKIFEEDKRYGSASSGAKTGGKPLVAEPKPKEPPAPPEGGTLRQR